MTGEAETPHFHGHRDRLRLRLREAGSDALADYELLELVLFRAMPRRDVKPLAKTLIARFGSFAEVLTARPERLMEVSGVGETVVTELKIVEASARRLARGELRQRPFDLGIEIDRGLDLLPATGHGAHSSMPSLGSSET